MTAARVLLLGIACWVLTILSPLGAAEPPALTTMSDPSIKYQTPEKPYVVLKRADVEAVVVDNRAVKDDVLPGHRSQLSGIASLKHVKRPLNLFGPRPAG